MAPANSGSGLTGTEFPDTIFLKLCAGHPNISVCHQFTNSVSDVWTSVTYTAVANINTVPYYRLGMRPPPSQVAVQMKSDSCAWLTSNS
jgi:hypothetical protein